MKSNIIHATQVLNECLRLMKKAKDLDLRLSKAKLAIQKLRELLPYYEKGLVRLKPSPQEWVTRIHSEERKITNQHVNVLLKEAIRHAKQAPNASQRSIAFQKVEEAVSKYGDHLGRANKARWQSRIESETGFLLKDLESAGKRTTERDVALAQYIETLTMLRSEFTGSPDEIKELKRIEKLITDLGGQLPGSDQKEAKSDNAGPVKKAPAPPKHNIIFPQKKTGT